MKKMTNSKTPLSKTTESGHINIVEILEDNGAK